MIKNASKHTYGKMCTPLTDRIAVPGRELLLCGTLGMRLKAQVQ